ncbi:ribosome assembly cofactor RimP [Flavobacteriaceae bacterium F08102]|nr:ribosome assembly cofactor RimP [Flavobacteriaceae bacterium F08102]
MRETIEQLVKEAIEENPSLFLIELKITTGYEITVIVDGDEGVNLKECMRISRHIEHNLDRESTDFSLVVTSPGATEPIVNNRQYKKNLGKTLNVRTEENKFEGELTEVLADHITLTWKAREPKPVGKGKVTVIKTVDIPYEQIKQAKVKLKF